MHPYPLAEEGRFSNTQKLSSSKEFHVGLIGVWQIFVNTTPMLVVWHKQFALKSMICMRKPTDFEAGMRLELPMDCGNLRKSIFSKIENVG